jgi:hypothetical protein
MRKRKLPVDNIKPFHAKPIVDSFSSGDILPFVQNQLLIPNESAAWGKILLSLIIVYEETEHVST